MTLRLVNYKSMKARREGDLPSIYNPAMRSDDLRKFTQSGTIAKIRVTNPS